MIKVSRKYTKTFLSKYYQSGKALAALKAGAFKLAGIIERDYPEFEIDIEIRPMNKSTKWENECTAFYQEISPTQSKFVFDLYWIIAFYHHGYEQHGYETNRTFEPGIDAIAGIILHEFAHFIQHRVFPEFFVERYARFRQTNSFNEFAQSVHGEDYAASFADAYDSYYTEIIEAIETYFERNNINI